MKSELKIKHVWLISRKSLYSNGLKIGSVDFIVYNMFWKRLFKVFARSTGKEKCLENNERERTTSVAKLRREMFDEPERYKISVSWQLDETFVGQVGWRWIRRGSRMCETRLGATAKSWRPSWGGDLRLRRGILGDIGTSQESGKEVIDLSQISLFSNSWRRLVILPFFVLGLGRTEGNAVDRDAPRTYGVLLNQEFPHRFGTDVRGRCVVKSIRINGRTMITFVQDQDYLECTNTFLSDGKIEKPTTSSKDYTRYSNRSPTMTHTLP